MNEVEARKREGIGQENRIEGGEKVKVKWD